MATLYISKSAGDLESRAELTKAMRSKEGFGRKDTGCTNWFITNYTAIWFPL